MAAEESKDGAEIITVGKVTDDGRAVWDVDPLHPANYNQAAGEVFIADMRPYKVHNSRGIQQKVGEKALREISDAEASRRTKLAEDADKAREDQRQEMMKTQTANSVPAVEVPPVLADNSAVEEEEQEEVTQETGMAPPTNAPQQTAASTDDGGRRLPRRNTGTKPPER